MNWKQIFKNNHEIFLILLIAAFLRFVGLNWGWPYQFHPDEWNMAHAITKLTWTNKLNPDFFAYGQFPLYLTYFSASAFNLILRISFTQINLSEATFFLRFWSAVAGVGIVYWVYLISQHLFDSRFSLIAAALAAFTPGLIQNSHFGTTESILTFCFLAIIYFSLKIIEKPTRQNYLWAAFFSALALASKITGLIFLFPLATATGICFFSPVPRQEKLRILGISFLALVFTVTLTSIFSPYLWLNFSESRRILTYESLVAAGQIPVFYTRQFFQTFPILFQSQKIFPFALGWPLFIFGLIGLILTLAITIQAFRQKKSPPLKWPLFLLNFAFWTYFLSQAFLFTKWTRFMAPVFPFFSIFSVWTIQSLAAKIKHRQLLIPYYISLISLLIFPGAVFFTLYLKPDIRLSASEWIYKNIPSGSQVLSESGNVVDLPVPLSYLPLPNYHLVPTSFDFYRLDEDPKMRSRLIAQLAQADYLIIPSRRVFANHQRLPEKFPLTAKYYQLLFSGQLGFKLIKEFSPFDFSLFSYHLSLFDDEGAEETWSVFDHPVIRIYQKTEKLTTKDYERLLQK